MRFYSNFFITLLYSININSNTLKCNYMVINLIYLSPKIVWMMSLDRIRQVTEIGCWSYSAFTFVSVDLCVL